MDVEYAGSSARATSPALDATLTITAARLSDPGHCLTRDEERALEVGVETRVPVDLREVLDPPDHVDTSVVHDDVEPAGVVDQAERARDGRRVRDIHRDGPDVESAGRLFGCHAPPARHVPHADVDGRAVGRRAPAQSRARCP